MGVFVPETVAFKQKGQSVSFEGDEIGVIGVQMIHFMFGYLSFTYFPHQQCVMGIIAYVFACVVRVSFIWYLRSPILLFVYSVWIILSFDFVNWAFGCRLCSVLSSCNALDL